MDYHIIIITAAMILLDYITGIIKAASAEGIKSRKMRAGLFHKTGLILCIVLGLLLDYAQTVVDLGLPVSVPVASAICAYIILMEAASVIENVCIISPGLMPDKLRALFGLTAPNITNDTEKEEK